MGLDSERTWTFVQKGRWWFRFSPWTVVRVVGGPRDLVGKRGANAGLHAGRTRRLRRCFAFALLRSSPTHDKKHLCQSSPSNRSSPWPSLLAAESCIHEGHFRWCQKDSEFPSFTSMTFADMAANSPKSVANSPKRCSPLGGS